MDRDERDGGPGASPPRDRSEDTAGLGSDDAARLSPAQELAALVLLVVAVAAGAVATGVVSPAMLDSLAADPAEPDEEPTPVVPREPLGPLPTAEVGGGTTAPAPTATRSAANPWGRERVVVAVEDRTALNRSFVPAVRAAVAFWDRNPDLGDYPVEFVVRPDAEDPDVVVQYAETFVCGDHGDPKGCAPILSADDTPPDPVRVQIGATEAGNFRTDRNAVIHELGHVLGLGHCEEPAWVMSTGCPDVADRPNASERAFAWRDATIRVHFDYGSVEENRSVVEQQVRLAVAAYAAGEGAAPANLTFRRVEERYLADVSVRLGVDDACDPGVRGCATFAGPDLDGDGAPEYRTRASITLGSLPPGETGWYLGRWLGRVLTPGSLPERFLSLAGEGPWWEGLADAGTDDAGVANGTDGALDAPTPGGASDDGAGVLPGAGPTGPAATAAGNPAVTATGAPATPGPAPGRRP